MRLWKLEFRRDQLAFGFILLMVSLTIALPTLLPALDFHHFVYQWERYTIFAMLSPLLLLIVALESAMGKYELTLLPVILILAGILLMYAIPLFISVKYMKFSRKDTVGIMISSFASLLIPKALDVLIGGSPINSNSIPSYHPELYSFSLDYWALIILPLCTIFYGIVFFVFFTLVKLSAKKKTDEKPAPEPKTTKKRNKPNLEKIK